MDEQILDQPRPSTDTSLDRRAFLSTAAKAAVGVAGAGAILAGDPIGALAERERLRSISILRKPAVPISFILPGSPADQVTWNHVSQLFQARHPNIKVTVQVVSITTGSSYFAKILTMVAGGRTPVLDWRTGMESGMPRSPGLRIPPCWFHSPTLTDSSSCMKTDLS